MILVVDAAIDRCATVQYNVWYCTIEKLDVTNEPINRGCHATLSEGAEKGTPSWTITLEPQPPFGVGSNNPFYCTTILQVVLAS